MYKKYNYKRKIFKKKRWGTARIKGRSRPGRFGR